MERGINMVMHAAIFTAIAYFVMLNYFKQSPEMAEDRSILLGSILLIYMLIYGHQMPSYASLNKNIYP
jgi:hypothetical protein